MNDPIGALCARITLQQPTRVADELGGAAILWINTGDVWADIRAGGVSDGAGYDTARAATGYSVTINRRSDVRAGWRVQWGARRMRVIGVRDDGAPRITLTCEEEFL